MRVENQPRKTGVTVSVTDAEKESQSWREQDCDEVDGVKQRRLRMLVTSLYGKRRKERPVTVTMMMFFVSLTRYTDCRTVFGIERVQATELNGTSLGSEVCSDVRSFIVSSVQCSRGDVKGPLQFTLDQIIALAGNALQQTPAAYILK